MGAASFLVASSAAVEGPAVALGAVAVVPVLISAALRLRAVVGETGDLTVVGVEVALAVALATSVFMVERVAGDETAAAAGRAGAMGWFVPAAGAGAMG